MEGASHGGSQMAMEIRNKTVVVTGAVAGAGTGLLVIATKMLG